MKFSPLQQTRGNDFTCTQNHSGVRSRLSSRYQGFSLIEVVLALGVVSFAFVALFGLLPVGLNAFNNSIDATMETQIAENVMSQLKQEKFSMLYSEFNDSAASANTSNGQPSFYKPSNTNYQKPATGYYYDDQGNLIAFVQQVPPVGAVNPVTTAPTNYIYSASVQVYYDPWTSTGTLSTPPYNIQPTNNTIASGTTVNPATPQPLATVVITISKFSSPNTARIYTGYIVNNGL